MARILLAEDDEALRRFLSLALEKAGHTVDAVGDGELALAALSDAQYDLLVADIVMPGIDGIELARRASTQSSGMRVMFITGFAAVAMSRRNDLIPGSRVLSKPFHLRELVDQIDRFLAA